MPEQWIDDVVGDETRPRLGFEDRLAGQLAEGYPSGGIYRFDGTRIVQDRASTLHLRSRSVRWSPARPVSRSAAPESPPDQKPELVYYTFTTVGGSDQGNSTALDDTKMNVFGVRTPISSGTLDLPSALAEAGQIVIGFCNYLPVRAD